VLKNLFTRPLLLSSILGLACACSSTRIANGEKAQHYYGIGVGLLSDNQIPESIAALEQARGLDPENPSIRTHLGLAYMKLEKMPQAETHLTEAVKLNPNYPDAWNNLAAYYIETKKPKEAINAANKALDNALYSTPEKALANLARAELLRKRPQDARDHVEKALRLNPESCGLRVLLSKTHLSLKDHESALSEAQKARRNCPSMEMAHLWEAFNLYRIGQRQQAKIKYEEIITLFKRSEAAEQSRVALRDLQRRVPLKEPKM
jgi:type IV pilus assembly protein PilF